MTDRDLPDMPDLPDLPCSEFVELVTDYLEDALPTDERARVDQHLGTCAGCRTVLAQWHEVMRLTGRLAETEVDDLDPDTRSKLMASFRQPHDR
jgi:anti-sigma factor RsiW